MSRMPIIILSCLLLLFGACSQGGDDDGFVPEDDTPCSSVLLNDTLRILDIGNSYTEDYTSLLPAIADNLGGNLKNVCYYNLVRPGGSFQSWYDCFYGRDTEAYYCQKLLGDIRQPVPTGNFRSHDSRALRLILSARWDLIILHPVSSYATNYAAWQTRREGGYLHELVALLRKSQPRTSFAFVLTHSYEHTYVNNKEGSTYERWQHISAAAQWLMTMNGNFRYLIPYGTAIENLRTVANTEHDLTRDGTHLGRGLARYAAALTVYQTLFYPRTGRSVADCTLTYTCSQWEIAGSRYTDGCIDVTAHNGSLAIEAALKACDSPYQCR